MNCMTGAIWQERSILDIFALARYSWWLFFCCSRESNSFITDVLSDLDGRLCTHVIHAFAALDPTTLTMKGRRMLHSTGALLITFIEVQGWKTIETYRSKNETLIFPQTVDTKVENISSKSGDLHVNGVSLVVFFFFRNYRLFST